MLINSLRHFSFSDSDEEEKAKKVTVRFENPETEKSRKAKEKSYGFLLRKIHEEPWTEVDYHKLVVIDVPITIINMALAQSFPKF